MREYWDTCYDWLTAKEELKPTAWSQIRGDDGAAPDFDRADMMPAMYNHRPVKSANRGVHLMYSLSSPSNIRCPLIFALNRNRSRPVYSANIPFVL